MSTTRKSIMKGTDRRGNPKKRLSFASSTENETTEDKDGGDPLHGSTLAETDLTCNMTPMGLCYSGKPVPAGLHTEHSSVPLKESHRSITSVLHFASSAGTTANVLVVGEKILGEKLKTYLLETHCKQHTKHGPAWRMNLNIMCEQTLTPAMVQTTHFIIFLFMMDTHESMMNLSRILTSHREDILPSKKMMVFAVSSVHGVFKNVVDLNQFHTLLDSYQLIHFPWKEQGRLRDIEVKRILDLIYKSVGYHRGASVLIDYIMQLNKGELLKEQKHMTHQ